MNDKASDKPDRIGRINRDTRLAFFQGFLRRPQVVGSVIPSSRFLERRILKYADIDRDDVIVELGPGTGGTTQALLDSLGPGGRVLSIDVEPEFIGLLGEIDDARLIPHLGSATDISDILRQHGLRAPDIVISGIPFSTMPDQVGRRIVREIHTVLPPGKSFVAYQFRDRVAELATPVFGTPQSSLELINIPPMRVYRWTVRETAEAVRETA